MPEPIRVQFSFRELHMAAAHGAMRQIQAIKEDAQDRNGEPAEGPWENHIESAIAEMCVAKMLGRYWSGVTGKGLPDVVPDIEVRQTKYDPGHLIVRARDLKHHAEHPFVLVVGRELMVRSVVGWMEAQEVCEVGEFMPDDGRGEAWKVKMRQLHEIEQLTEREP